MSQNVLVLNSLNTQTDLKGSKENCSRHYGRLLGLPHKTTRPAAVIAIKISNLDPLVAVKTFKGS